MSTIPFFDFHCDSLTKGGYKKLIKNDTMHWSLPRFIQGGGQLQVHAIFTPPEYKKGDATMFAMKYASEWQKFLEETNTTGVRSKEDLDEKGPFSILSLEDASPLAGNIEALDMFFDLGVRLITLVWSCDNEVGRGVIHGQGPAITKFGKNLIRKMNEKNVIVDLSHASDELFWEAVKTSSKPVVASHSNSRKFRNHPRNLTDDQIKEISNCDGIIGLVYVPNFVGEPPKGTQDEWDFELKGGAEMLAKHAAHIAEISKVETVVLGSDFDGTNSPVIAEVSKTQIMAEELKKVGFSDNDIEKIFYKNAKKFLLKNLP
ncbi:hypothetical protein CL643_03965 [bacterium]|nr:hypothetical protein [bacterium]